MTPIVKPDARTAESAARTVFFCFIAALCEGFDVQAAGVAAGGLSREFRPTPAQLGVFFSASGAGLLIGAVIGGRVADHVGRKAVLMQVRSDRQSRFVALSLTPKDK